MSEPTVMPPDVLAGNLASALDEAMFRVHDVHRSRHFDDRDWKRCETSTLCRDAAALLARPETQLALIASAAS